MKVIARREGFDFSKSRALQAAGQHDMAVEPSSPRRHLGKRHSHLERDSRLFGQHTNGADGPNGGDDRIEERAYFGRFALKVVGQAVSAASVRLIAVRKDAATVRTAPQR